LRGGIALEEGVLGFGIEHGGTCEAADPLHQASGDEIHRDR
jgi:hypothetical protein